ncbi:hypothetical protein PTNB73_04714 [Pyrenophora teres f. teres]|nr:hypothetical protein PTNB73_04714 [Pyrenophora teres f. teres]
MYIFTQLSILLCAASLVSAGCSVCPLGSGRCTAENGSGCRGAQSSTNTVSRETTAAGRLDTKLSNAGVVAMDRSMGVGNAGNESLWGAWDYPA